VAVAFVDSDGLARDAGGLLISVLLAIAYDIVFFWNFASLVKYATDGIR
jgi:hypothetical protein